MTALIAWIAALFVTGLAVVVHDALVPPQPGDDGGDGDGEPDRPFVLRARRDFIGYGRE